MLRLSALLIAVPALAFAAGADDANPPSTTTTTTTCSGGQVWDSNRGKCVDPSRSDLGDDALYQAARELAYDGQLQHAQAVLRAMSDQTDDRVLTYWGFTHRKLGNVTLAMAFYDRALTQNPDNLLARSYLGQAYVEEDDLVAALDQLTQIRTRGGAGSWAETALATAIETGATYAY